MRRLIRVALAGCAITICVSCRTGDRPEYRTVATRFVSALASRDTFTIRTLAVRERAGILMEGLPERDDRRVVAVKTAPMVQYRGSKDGRSNYLLHPAGRTDVGVWVLVQQSPNPLVYSYQLVPDLGP
jgi:hypothetical protein